MELNEAAESMTTLSAVTKLFRHDCEYCSSRWSKFSSRGEEQKDLELSITGASIIHRHTLQLDDWITESITIQNPDMKAHLRDALANYQDFDLELEGWTFRAPFKPLVHRWDRLNDTLNSITETLHREAVKQLIAFLNPILTPAVEALATTRRCGKVSFQDIWHIFPPGELVITTFYGVEAACRVIKYEKRDFPVVRWVISLEYIDWNGERCGYTNTKVNINDFDGWRYVVDLPVYPITFNESASQTRSRIIDRGRRFETLRGYHFQTCVGTKILLDTKEPEERSLAGRVVIDAYAYYQIKNMVRPQLRPLGGVGKGDCGPRSMEENKGSNISPSTRDSSPSADEIEVIDDVVLRETKNVENELEMIAKKSLNQAASRNECLESLTDDQCLLATPWLKGFDLKTKDWAQFRVDDLSPVSWNDNAFDNLVLPGNEKELAWAFVETKALASNSFDDFIHDKGRGIIILMFGPPGVGKTYTAEAVAERARVPLYAMSAGTLGTRPKQVEATLDEALDICRLWNAMLLLDEADVFLGARTNVDLARNELVAVFLTKLEYYQGVCFLTTNRKSSLDHAFQSRVDLFLPYTDLTVDARRQVWNNFIDLTGRDTFDVSPSDLTTLSELKLNGREIKNLIKGAHLLSLKNKEKIDVSRLEMLAHNRLKALATLAEPDV